MPENPALACVMVPDRLRSEKMSICSAIFQELSS